MSTGNSNPGEAPQPTPYEKLLSQIPEKPIDLADGNQVVTYHYGHGCGNPGCLAAVVRINVDDGEVSIVHTPWVAGDKSYRDASHIDIAGLSKIPDEQRGTFGNAFAWKSLSDFRSEGSNPGFRSPA